MGDFEGLIRDPEFQSKSWNERHAILKKVSPDGFAKAPATKQAAFMNEMKTQPWWQGGASKPDAASTSVSQGPSKWKKTASKIYTPVMEGLGMAGGAILGGGGGGVAGLSGGPAAPGTVPYGAITGGVAGAGLGYAAGKKGAQVLDVALGLGTEKPRPTTFTGAATEILKDIAEGSTMEMAGQVGGKMLTGGLNKLYAAKQKGAPFSDVRNRYRAAQQFNTLQESPVPRVNTLQRAEGQRTKALVNRLKPTMETATGEQVPIVPTLGQRQKNYRAAAFEQSRAAKDTEFAANLKLRDAELNKAAVTNLTKTLGKSAELPAVQPASITGEGQIKGIKKAMEPVLSKEAKMWADVPEYPMPAGNTLKAFEEAVTAPSTGQSAARELANVFQQLPRTVQGLYTIERQLNGAISKASKAGDAEVGHVLKQVRKAVAEDFDAMGSAAERGDIALSDGQIVFPSKIRSELKTAQDQLTEARRQLTLPSTKDPNIQAAVGKQMASAEERVATLQNRLADLQPAEDVAAKYAAAKKYSREEKFQRFFTDTMKSVKDSSGTLRIPAEQVPMRTFTPTGSKDLVKAVGKEAAAEQTMPHAVDQLVSKTVDASTGVMNVPRATAWMRQNKEALHNLGLTQSVDQIIKGQVPRAIESELEVLARSKPDVLGNPAVTPLQAAKLIKKYGPSVQKYYGAKGTQALLDYGHMMEVIGRNKYVSAAGGSTTAEKLMGDKVTEGAEKVASLLAVSTGHGWQFSSVKNLVKSFLASGLELNEKKIAAIMQEALVNPEAAEALIKIAKAKPRVVSTQAAGWLKPIINQMQIQGKLGVEDRKKDEEQAAKDLEQELATSDEMPVVTEDTPP
jgi:hypothetical protein